MELYNENELLYEDLFKEWKKEGKKNGYPAPEKFDEPYRELIYTSDTTKESLIDQQNLNEHGIAIINDEISSLLRGMNQYKGKGNDEQYFLASWSTDKYITTRKGDKIPTTIRPCHNILGTTQPDEVEKLIFKEIKSTNGLAERWLYVLSDHVQSGYVNRNEIPLALMESLKLTFEELFSLEEIYYSLSLEAQQIFDAHYKVLTDECKNHKHPELLQSYLVKQKAYVARFALVATLFGIIKNKRNIRFNNEKCN